ncbi:hypothetical protein RN001_012825 [Aquatica leii]|uniref:PiggyBac transposable element-derived protein domain-containing protein n=1 Tax=Aquatica leii TaxID=1421715 RepID=A0AAN7SMM4_9COLE|nr:hypothetical protein RN001_012825 [Aquatica leii]
MNNDSEWESDDDVPLAQLKLGQNDDVWTCDVAYCNHPGTFPETVGPNISNTIKTPTEIFLKLFSETLLDKIVFETIYKNGGNKNNFRSTNAEKMKAFLVRCCNMVSGSRKKSVKFSDPDFAQTVMEWYNKHESEVSSSEHDSEDNEDFIPEELDTELSSSDSKDEISELYLLPINEDVQHETVMVEKNGFK